jgi:hypothetical protein
VASFQLSKRILHLLHERDGSDCAKRKKEENSEMNESDFNHSFRFLDPGLEGDSVEVGCAIGTTPFFRMMFAYLAVSPVVTTAKAFFALS